MNNSINELLAKGYSLITPTQRLSRHLRHQYATQQITAGHAAWQTPDVLPWTAWCKRTFAVIAHYDSRQKILLGSFQQQWLWQEIIANSHYKDQLLQTQATAKQAAFAYQLCREACIPVFAEGIYLAEDARAFKSWVDAYEQRKQSSHWLDDASLPDYLLQIINDKNAFSDRLAFYGFDQFTAQQQRLIDGLGKAGTEVVIIDLPERNQSTAVSAQVDARSEYIAAANWTRHQIEKDPDATIGILTPQLNAIRAPVEQAFNAVFMPAYLVEESAANAKPFSIALGKSLASYPLIHTAMDLLSLSKRQMTLKTLGNLLHSPFIKDANNEQSQRASFYAVLRQAGEQRLSFKSLNWIYAMRCKEHEQCGSFMRLLKTFETNLLGQAKNQSLHQWAIVFSEWLAIFNWAGDRDLNSDEFQTLKAWRDTLAQLGQLDVLTKPVTCNTALCQLRRLLTEKRFQPETAETPIQISGMIGAAGMQFDYIWVLGMQNNVWPELLPPNPFIPAVCQRDYNVPGANASIQLEHAQNITANLIQSAKEVVFSYSLHEGDRDGRPSPLIRPYMKNDINDDFSNYEDYEHIIYRSAKTESFRDTQAPAIPTGELASGGSALFRDQAACPFKAFARHRLFAQSLPAVDVGLNAIDRGNLAHCALQLLWLRLKDKENLDSKSQAERGDLIKSVVNEAIRQQAKQQPETFTDRFTELERLRLQKLLGEWIMIEYHRDNFKVIATEQWQSTVFENIELHLRVDRIDEIADGRCVIIDYKTGNVSISDWQSERPPDPQLPLYAITSEQEVAAIAYGGLKRGKLGFAGMAENDALLPGVKSNVDMTWQAQLDQWRTLLIRFANDFRNGEATVDPTMAACRYCELHSLCRIYERVGTPDGLLTDKVGMHG